MYFFNTVHITDHWETVQEHREMQHRDPLVRSPLRCCFWVYTTMTEHQKPTLSFRQIQGGCESVCWKGQVEVKLF